jgi:L-alanine-DL-glutamate epimerase-like enolase superfamily enzyme
VDVLQYDFMHFMYSGWLRTGREYDKHGIKSAPHHYGAFLGNVVCAHFHELIAGFMAVEWDEAKFDALDISAYKIADGKVRIPELPGFGVELDESEYAAAVKNGGFIAG